MLAIHKQTKNSKLVSHLQPVASPKSCQTHPPYPLISTQHFWQMASLRLSKIIIGLEDFKQTYLNLFSAHSTTLEQPLHNRIHLIFSQLHLGKKWNFYTNFKNPRASLHSFIIHRCWELFPSVKSQLEVHLLFCFHQLPTMAYHDLVVSKQD